jgi:hypothetical protein
VNPELHLQVAGALQIGVAALSLGFPRRFDWKNELPRLSLLNRQIFVVHTLFISVTVLMFGALSLCAAPALLEPTPLSRLVLGGLAAFWTLRLVVQWFVYDARLWRGQAFNTVVHVLLSALYAYLSAVYAGVLMLQT